MKPFPHYLGRNHSSQIPSNCIWFDTETNEDTDSEGMQHHKLWFGYAVYQRRLRDNEWEPEQWLRFDTIDMFWEWVVSRCRKKTRLFLFSHNGAFDLPVMDAFRQLPERGFELINAIADAPPLILEWVLYDYYDKPHPGVTDPERMNMKRRRVATIKFIDTLNIWRMALSKIGESVGLPKLEMPQKNAPPEAWDVYGKNDVKVIQRVILKWFEFIRNNDLGGFSPTLASQSFNAYRHRFMQTPIFIDANERATVLARAAYVGGRTECFRLGIYTGDFYLLDFNSFYPSVMASGVYPNKLVGVYSRPKFDDVLEWMDYFSLLADVTIETDEPCYPIESEHKLIFPIGTFRVCLATPEFKYAIEHDHIKTIHRVAIYEQAELFHDFITTLYDLRLQALAEGRTVDVWLYKILMNSLYGKFGQRGRVFETVGSCDFNIIEIEDWYDADTKESFQIRRFGGIEQKLSHEGEGRNSHPAIAAHVTSYARLKLWKAAKQAGLENVWYCDTDSLVVNLEGYTRLTDQLDQHKLGSLALEKRLTQLTIHGCKDYTFDSVTRTKGVRANALWTGPNSVVQDQFVGLRGLLRRGNLSAPLVFSQTKTLKRHYDKGRVSSSGRVTPWCLPGDRSGSLKSR